MSPINKLVVKIVTLREEGSSFLFLPAADSDFIYVFTAKHCIYSHRFNNGAINTDICIQNLEGAKYQLTASDEVLSHSTADICVLKIKKRAIESVFGSIPVSRIGGHNTYTEYTIKGFPNIGKQYSPGNIGEAISLGANIILHDCDEKTGKLVFQSLVTITNESERDDYKAKASVESISGAGIFAIIEEYIYFIGIISKFKTEIMQWEGVCVCIQQMLDYLPKPIVFDIRAEQQISDSWWKNIANLAIQDLSVRYTPDVHVANPRVANIFNGLAINEIFEKEFRDIFNSFFICLNKLNWQKYKNAEIESKKAIIFDLFNEYKFGKSIKLIKNELNKILELIEKEVKILKNKEKKDDVLHVLYDCKNSVESLLANLKNVNFQLTLKPILVLLGEAGVGKSHILADIVAQRIKTGQPSIFILGQHLNTEEDPRIQILKKLGFTGDFSAFLKFLNEKGRASGGRAIIFIDALNEGAGNKFWKNYLNGFIEELSKYEHIGLACSIRSSYKESILAEVHQDKYINYEHTGFENAYDATKIFFDNYGFPIPNNPLLQDIYQKPLFLKMLCEGMKNNGITELPKGKEGVHQIFDNFIKGANRKLSENFGYSPSINLVDKAIKALIREKVSNNLIELEYDRAIKRVNEVVEDYISHKNFINELASESLLIIEKADGDSQNVRIAYDLLENHLTAQLQLEKYKNDIDGFKKAFSEEGEFFKYVNFLNRHFLYQGILEAFFVQVPAFFGRDFLEIIPNSSTVYIKNAFVASLTQRTTNHFYDITWEYIFKYFSIGSWHNYLYASYAEYFANEIIAVTGIEDYPLNALYLHKCLCDFSMSERDAVWAEFIRNNFIEGLPIQRLIDWAWSSAPKKNISNASVLLISTTLTWFLTSPYRQLRDSATKALICLLESRISLLIPLLERFLPIEEPYIHERLFAIVYGCVVRCGAKYNLQDLKPLCDYIYTKIFNQEEVYPHILLRDYACNTLEYFEYLGGELDRSEAMPNFHPPYKSTWVKTPPDIRTLEQKYPKNTSYAIWESLRGGIADFSRYIVGHAIEFWTTTKITEPLLNAFEEFDTDFAIRWILNEVFQMGWSDVKHGRYEKNLSSFERTAHASERIGKKYQWIAFHKLVAHIADEFVFVSRDNHPRVSSLYSGAWEPSMRDIDPTILIKQKQDSEEELEIPETDLALEHEEWLDKKDDLPNICDLIEITDKNGVEWFVLEKIILSKTNVPIGEEEYDSPRKSLVYTIRSYLVLKAEFENVYNSLCGVNFVGHGCDIPESGHKYGMFSRESYWSPAQASFDEEYDSCGDELRIKGKYIAIVRPTALEFIWDLDRDFSKNKSIYFYKPCELLYEGMGMSFGDAEGEFTNSSGEVIAYDPSVNYPANSCLLVRKDALLAFLEKSDYDIVWTFAGVKLVLGGNGENRANYPSLEIGGLGRIKNDQLESSISYCEREEEKFLRSTKPSVDTEPSVDNGVPKHLFEDPNVPKTLEEFLKYFNRNFDDNSEVEGSDDEGDDEFKNDDDA